MKRDKTKDECNNSDDKTICENQLFLSCRSFEQKCGRIQYLIILTDYCSVTYWP